MSSKTVTTPSRHVKRATASRAAAAPSPRRSNASKSVAAPAHKNGAQPVATEAPLAQRALKMAKSKTGLAIAAGVALAVAGGLVHKYRKA